MRVIWLFIKFKYDSAMHSMVNFTRAHMIFLSRQIRQNEIRAPSFFGRRLIIYNYKRDPSPNYVLERVKTCICLRFITISYM